MVREGEKHAAADQEKKERIEAVNQAEGVLHDTESKVEEFKDQLPAEDVEKIKIQITECRNKLADKDNMSGEEIKKTVDELQKSSLKLFEMAYKVNFYRVFLKHFSFLKNSNYNHNFVLDMYLFQFYQYFNSNSTYTAKKKLKKKSCLNFLKNYFCLLYLLQYIYSSFVFRKWQVNAKEDLELPVLLNLVPVQKKAKKKTNNKKNLVFFLKKKTCLQTSH